MYLLYSLILTLLLSGPIWAHEAGKSPSPVDTVEIGFLTTPNHGPYPVMIVHDTELVKVLCGYEHKTTNKVWGCASWIGEPAAPGNCMLIVQDTPDLSREFAREIVEHEVRHCLEGEFHDKDGVEKPKPADPPAVPDTHP